jgi:hypothetical protein
MEREVVFLWRNCQGKRDILQSLDGWAAQEDRPEASQYYESKDLIEVYLPWPWIEVTFSHSQFHCMMPMLNNSSDATSITKLQFPDK